MTPSDRGSQPKNAAGRPRQSSGKLPAHVYRRRRITLGVLSFIVLGFLALGIVGIATAMSGGDSEGEVSAEPEETAETTTAAPVPNEKAASGKCPEERVALRAEVDPKSVEEGKKPEFGMVIENRNDVTCLIEVGTKEQEFIVEKDGDVIWSSTYCAAEEDENAEASTEFAPGSKKTAKLEWNRIRVDENCNRTNKEFAAGEYELVVKLGDMESEPATFELEKDAATKAKEKKAAEDKEKSEEKASDAEKSEGASSDEKDGDSEN